MPLSYAASAAMNPARGVGGTSPVPDSSQSTTVLAPISMRVSSPQPARATELDVMLVVDDKHVRRAVVSRLRSLWSLAVTLLHGSFTAADADRSWPPT